VENDPEIDLLVRVVVQAPESTLSEVVKVISGRYGFAGATVKTVSTNEPNPKLVQFTNERGSPEKETLKRADQSVLVLGKIAAAISENLGVSKETPTAVKDGNKDIHIAIKDGSSKTEALHRDFTAGLTHLDSVYGNISKTLVKIDHDLQE
jgi:hypothetical protein